ncbi:uncharacterized protein BJ212DRAFT_1276340 [Suillus subaureus]|uniref:Uncharacterized protein n=1 Tax=Suillus subaureus TaxID=48587 RepID=A0A9P7E6G0_9AGAM|nr:uncharacterized protein BJ212DRAFT_1276340 [Suillus subaureus]KAG1812444.1 hypothetical protein BJ212DRAFT_1276340 [Suillus subaureus]
MEVDTTPAEAKVTQTVSNLGPGTYDRIQTLRDFHIRLQSIRHIPSLLLRHPSGSSLSHENEFTPPFDPADHDFAAPFHTTPTQDFRTLKTIADALRSEKLQEALKVARESEEADKSDLGLFQRDSRKRKRPLSPVGSPQPYIPPPPRTSSLFPPIEDESPCLRAEGLVEYIREFNRGDIKSPPGPGTSESFQPKCRLYIWSRTRSPQLYRSMNGPPPKLTSPVILRFTIEDVLTAYVSLVFTHSEDPLLVESVTAFGPREMKLPHMQSDYLAFQVLSQHIAKMVQSHPQVPLQTLVYLLVSYQGLFVDRCTSCERVLSVEGHVPPAGRLWIPTQQPIDLDVNKTDEPDPGVIINPDATPARSQTTDHLVGHWESRHVTCMYN